MEQLDLPVPSFARVGDPVLALLVTLYGKPAASVIICRTHLIESACPARQPSRSDAVVDVLASVVDVDHPTTCIDHPLQGGLRVGHTLVLQQLHLRVVLGLLQPRLQVQQIRRRAVVAGEEIDDIRR